MERNNRCAARNRGLPVDWSVSSNGLPHLEHGGRNSLNICVLSGMQMRLAARVDQRQNCVYLVLQGSFAISLIEPQKTAGQLPQIISSVTDRKFAGSMEHVGGLPPKRRGLYIRGAFHGWRDG